MAKQYLARIPPQSPRSQHTIQGRTFRKSDGWVGPLTEGKDDDLIEALRAEPLNELHPDNSPKVFEVKALKEAKDVHTKENKKKRPAGTPDKPNETPKATGTAASKGRVGATSKGDGKDDAKDKDDAKGAKDDGKKASAGNK